MYSAGDVRIENVSDAAIKEPTDAIVRIRPFAKLAPKDRVAAAGVEVFAQGRVVEDDIRRGMEVGRGRGRHRRLAADRPGDPASRHAPGGWRSGNE